MTGHLLGAAGGIESALVLFLSRRKFLLQLIVVPDPDRDPIMFQTKCENQTFLLLFVTTLIWWTQRDFTFKVVDCKIHWGKLSILRACRLVTYLSLQHLNFYD